MNKLLGLLGLLKNGNLLMIGEEPCAIAMKSGKAKFIFVASDAAERSKRRAREFSKEGGATYKELLNNKQEIGIALGRSSVAMFAADAKTGSAIVKKMEEVNV